MQGLKKCTMMPSQDLKFGATEENSSKSQHCIQATWARDAGHCVPIDSLPQTASSADFFGKQNRLCHSASHYRNKLPDKVNLKRAKVYFGSMFCISIFQATVNWLLFWRSTQGSKLLGSSCLEARKEGGHSQYPLKGKWPEDILHALINAPTNSPVEYRPHL